jgi:hypothetical protein
VAAASCTQAILARNTNALTSGSEERYLPTSGREGEVPSQTVNMDNILSPPLCHESRCDDWRKMRRKFLAFSASCTITTNCLATSAEKLILTSRETGPGNAA